MTEHAAVIFVFFFLAEYASIVLICILNAILFFGGYLFDYTQILYVFNNIIFISDFPFNYPLLEGMLSGLTIGIKSCVMIFIFI
jgi:NADH-ubiquinone oxidoreductase chain 1